MDRKRARNGDLTDDRIDALVRTAALAGPTAGDDRGAGLPVLTRVLIGSGLVACASLALAVVVVGGRATPAPNPEPMRVAEAPETTPDERPDTELGAAGEAPVLADAAREPTRRSFVIARFTPEDSTRLEALWFSPEDGGAASSGRPVETAGVSPSTDRRSELIALGRMLRSADVAADTLALMSPAEQLDVCVLWTSEPGLRPLAFERLAALSMDPAVAGDVRRAADELMNDPAMRPWVLSHGLASVRPSRFQGEL